MSARARSGFTIIEVILFLALSGLFIIIAFAGISRNNGNVQFSDSIRSLESFLQSQAANVYNGVNPHGTGASGDSILLGRVIQFTEDSDQVRVHIITGNRVADYESTIPSVPEPGGGPDRIGRRWNLANPVIVGEETYELKWGVNFVVGSNLRFGGGGFDTGTSYIGILRDPLNSNVVHVIFYDSDAVDLTNPEHYHAKQDAQVGPNGKTSYAARTNAFFCFVDPAGRRAEIETSNFSSDPSAPTLNENLQFQAHFDVNIEQCTAQNMGL